MRSMVSADDESVVHGGNQFENGVLVGKLDGKVAVITGATSGMALASAKLDRKSVV